VFVYLNRSKPFNYTVHIVAQILFVEKLLTSILKPELMIQNGSLDSLVYGYRKCYL